MGGLRLYDYKFTKAFSCQFLSGIRRAREATQVQFKQRYGTFMNLKLYKLSGEAIHQLMLVIKLYIAQRLHRECLPQGMALTVIIRSKRMLRRSDMVSRKTTLLLRYTV